MVECFTTTTDNTVGNPYQKTLHLNLMKEYFDMIYSGYKPEEYRKLTPYWGGRLTKLINFEYIDDMELYWGNNNQIFKHYDTITFSNGYAKDRSQFIIELKAIVVGCGSQKWGAKDGEKYFILILGKILSSKNIN